MGEDSPHREASIHPWPDAASRLEAQGKVLERIARGDPLEEILDSICRDVETLYPGSRCSILTVDPVERVLHHAAAPSLPVEFQQAMEGLPVAEGMGACGTAAHRSAQVIVTDVFADTLTAPFLEIAADHELKAVWSHPLLDRNGTILGTFAVYRQRSHQPDEHEISDVTSSGHLAAIALERRRYEDEMRLASLVDPLTGLPNRLQFLQWLERALELNPSSLAVMFLDMDRFKGVNDSLGHPAGDLMLVQVAKRLASALRSDDVLSRFGGDEFTILIRDADSRGISAVVERVQATFAEPIEVEDREFHMSVSIGVARAEPGSGPFDLIRDADVAMFAAKAQGPGRCVVFGDQLRHRALERVTLESELRRALERGELVAHYQPVYDLRTRACVAAEALVRWQHPERGLLTPDAFVPLAEETGLIVDLGAVVLDTVLAQVRRWGAQGIELPVSVNVSPLQLSDPLLVDTVLSGLTRHGVPPHQLVLELTETAVMEHFDSALCALEDLAEGGVRVFIDDFGTGYSSIGRLSDLPVAGLKIDRDFTRALPEDTSILKVITAIIDLARSLGLYAVAEGIETEEALETLLALGCGVGQGYHLGRPAGPEAITQLFAGADDAHPGGGQPGSGAIP